MGIEFYLEEFRAFKGYRIFSVLNLRVEEI
jgi:hypothetical protein